VLCEAERYHPSLLDLKAELEDAARKIRDMQELLEKMGGCGCETLDACGSVMRSRRKGC